MIAVEGLRRSSSLIVESSHIGDWTYAVSLEKQGVIATFVVTLTLSSLSVVYRVSVRKFIALNMAIGFERSQLSVKGIPNVRSSETLSLNEVAIPLVTLQSSSRSVFAKSVSVAREMLTPDRI